MQRQKKIDVLKFYLVGGEKELSEFPKFHGYSLLLVMLCPNCNYLFVADKVVEQGPCNLAVCVTAGASRSHSTKLDQAWYSKCNLSVPTAAEKVMYAT